MTPKYINMFLARKTDDLTIPNPEMTNTVFEDRKNLASDSTEWGCTMFSHHLQDST